MKTLSKVFMVIAVMVMAFAMQSCGSAAAKNLAEEINKECPQDLGDGVRLESVTAESNSIVYLYTVALADEYDVDDIISDESKPAAIQGLKQEAKTNEKLFELLDCCKTLDMNIVYRYKNTTTGNTKDLVITSSDMK